MVPQEYWASLVAQTVKRICLQCGRPRFDPWVRKILWRREWLPTPVLLPREFPGQRSLADYSSQHRKEQVATEQLTLTFSGILGLPEREKVCYSKYYQEILLHLKKRVKNCIWHILGKYMYTQHAYAYLRREISRRII